MNITDIHIRGEIKVDYSSRILYSTDASAYREIPLGVAYPKDIEDIRVLVILLVRIG